MNKISEGPYFCHIEGCDRDAPFDRLSDLRQHLTKVHGIEQKLNQNCHLDNWGYIEIEKGEKTMMKKVMTLL